jgi:hypothetical protein
MGDDTNTNTNTSGDANKKRPDHSCAFHELFSFADPWDHLLMAAGSLGALAHGAAMPAFFLLFGRLINGFGHNQLNLRHMTDEVSKVSHTHISPISAFYFHTSYISFLL